MKMNIAETKQSFPMWEAMHTPDATLPKHPNPSTLPELVFFFGGGGGGSENCKLISQDFISHDLYFAQTSIRVTP